MPAWSCRRCLSCGRSLPLRYLYRCERCTTAIWWYAHGMVPAARHKNGMIEATSPLREVVAGLL
jgi:hypothetical protein